MKGLCEQGASTWVRFLFSALKIWHAHYKLPSWRNSFWQILGRYFLLHHIIIPSLSCVNSGVQLPDILLSSSGFPTLPFGLSYPGQTHKHFNFDPIDCFLPELTLQSIFFLFYDCFLEILLPMELFSPQRKYQKWCKVVFIVSLFYLQYVFSVSHLSYRNRTPIGKLMLCAYHIWNN